LIGKLGVSPFVDLYLYENNSFQAGAIALLFSEQEYVKSKLDALALLVADIGEDNPEPLEKAKGMLKQLSASPRIPEEFSKLAAEASEIISSIISGSADFKSGYGRLSGALDSLHRVFENIEIKSAAPPAQTPIQEPPPPRRRLIH
jgi:hypothetical protein